ncbi:MAG: MFS transporter [Ardenticatenaceae bacterium]|nr:MFS transporter [Ardenticatenaceae bacterium]
MWRVGEERWWVVMVVIGLGTALSLLGDTSMYTVLPTHTVDAAITLAAVGVMLSANRWVRLLSNGPAGWLADRWPRRWVFVPALFLGAGSTAVYGLTQGYGWLLIGRLLWGIAWSGIWVSGNAIVLDLATTQNRGRLIGFYNVAFFLGAGTGSFVGGWLTDSLGYAAAFRVMAVVTLAGAVVAWLFLPETRGWRGVGEQGGGGEERGEGGGVKGEGGGVSWREMGAVLGLMGVNRLVMAGTLLPTFGLFLQHTLGDSVVVWGRVVGITTLTGLGLSLSSYIGTAFVPLAGVLSDRWGSRWRTTAVGLLPGMAGFVMLAGGVPWMIPLALPLNSMTSGSNQGMATALVGDLAGKRSGRFLGFLFTVGDFASAVGPLLVFWLLERVALRPIYLVAGMLYGVMFVVAGWWSVKGRGT